MSTKKLGFGLMRLPLLDADDATTIDIEQAKQMVDTFIENDFHFFQYSISVGKKSIKQFIKIKKYLKSIFKYLKMIFIYDRIYVK